ncbi:MAG: hypothetical protein DSZ29_05840 [Aquificaceae bacterium]|nr:MAG: hypothetical protein DSZ29_05840 [Aquificaceae bacterium]
MKSTFALLLALTACQSSIPVKDAKTPDQCGASEYASLMGQSSDIFSTMTFPAPMRIIKHGMAITMDYQSQRLNFDLDKSGRIQRIWCG